VVTCGQANKKFGKTAFYDTLQKLNDVPRMKDRGKALYKTLKDWQGFFQDQTDDVIVVMLRRKPEAMA